jgi:DNA-binding NtrC family response regulator
MEVERSEGNQAKAARLLGVSRFTLREELKLYGKHPNSHSMGSKGLLGPYPCG